MYLHTYCSTIDSRVVGSHNTYLTRLQVLTGEKNSSFQSLSYYSTIYGSTYKLSQLSLTNTIRVNIGVNAYWIRRTLEVHTMGH